MIFVSDGMPGDGSRWGDRHIGRVSSGPPGRPRWGTVAPEEQRGIIESGRMLPERGGLPAVALVKGRLRLQGRRPDLAQGLLLVLLTDRSPIKTTERGRMVGGGRGSEGPGG